MDKNNKNLLDEKYSLKKQLALAPGYLLLVTWVGFTAIVLIWVIGASFSTPADIFRGTIFKFTSGLHFENYSRPGYHQTFQSSF